MAAVRETWSVEEAAESYRGWRGVRARMLARLSVFAHQAGARLRSIDLNPVFAMPEGEGAFAADAVIEMAVQ